MPTKAKVETFIAALKSRILTGEFKNGDRLPSFRTLAAEYNTTQETINKTMQALQAEGLLNSMGAKGTFVNSSTVRLLKFSDYDFFKYLQKEKLNPIDENLEEPKFIKASVEVKQALSLSENSLVIRQFRRQKTASVVFRLEEMFYPAKNLSKKSDLNPLQDIKAGSELEVFYVNDRILSRLPSIYEQKLLKVVRANPVIDIKRIAFSKDKKTAFYYQHLVLNANHFCLSYDYKI